MVSYVLNDGPRGVAPATRERVLSAIAELGYRRNNLARALRSSRSGTLGLIVPDLAKPFFAELSSAIEAAAFARGSRLLVGSAHFDTARQQQQLRALIDARVDAVILVASHDPAEAVSLLREANVRHTLVHRVHADAPGVGTDDEDAGRQAARHLIEHDHHRVALLGSGAGDDPVSRRAQGVLATFRGAARPIPAHRVVICPFPHLRDDAYRATRTLLANQPDITALCATTDEHAFGAVRAASEAGRRLGDDLALVSIDGTQIGAYLSPGLTTFAVDVDAIGSAAVDDVHSTRASAPSIRRFAVRPLIRGTCGCHPRE